MMVFWSGGCHNLPHIAPQFVDQLQLAIALDMPECPAIARRQTLRQGTDLVDRADDGHDIDYYCEYNEVTKAIWVNDGEEE